MSLREKNIQNLQKETLDVFIIGGGINGAVSAAALAARRVKVGLIDARDFAGFTSQHSSNLVWGGIKYLENLEFGLVNELCQSRNELLNSFPSTVKEIRFLTTLAKSGRIHLWFMLAGTWLYWLIGRGRTRIPRLYNLNRVSHLEPLINTKNSAAAIEYSDAYLHDNDARFVFNFVRSAMDKGCHAANYVRSINAEQDAAGLWHIQAQDEIIGETFTIKSKVLINAAGAFVDEHNAKTNIQTDYQHKFSKGVHLIVPRISRDHRVLAFFADDGRLFFTIPMANRTCIGTTDTIVDDPEAGVTDEDREFILRNINSRLDLAKPLSKADIIAERWGVRPLAVKTNQKSNNENTFQLSRKHEVEIDNQRKHISIFGGKLTDCLNVGEEICDAVQDLGIVLTPLNEKWYGEPSKEFRREYFKRCHQLGLDEVLASDTGEMLNERLWRRYGKHAMQMLDAIEKDSNMAKPMLEGLGIRQCEVAYLKDNEMIVKLEDYLRRRSKIELLLSQENLKSLSGLQALCEQLFGEQADEKLTEYFAE